MKSIVPTIPPPTPVGIATPGRRYPAPSLKLSGRAAEVLADLRAVDTSWAALGMRRPVAPAPRPLPTRTLIERLTLISTAIHADYDRHVDTLAVLGDISALADASDTHALLMALAPVVAMLKGSVAL